MCVLILITSETTLAKRLSGTVDLNNFTSPYEALPATDAQVSLTFDMQINWQAWILLGEPVTYSEAHWRLKSIRLKIAGEIKRLTPCHSANSVDCLPSEIAKKIQLLGVKLLMPIIDESDKSNSSLALLLDPGVFSEPDLSIKALGLKNNYYGKPSYNTPGSRNWNKTIISNLLRAQGYGLQDSTYTPQYLNVEEAKALFIYGFSLTHSLDNQAVPLSLQVGYSALSQYLLNQSEQAISEQIDKEKSARLQSASKTISQIEDDDIFAEFEQAYVEEQIDEEVKEDNFKSKQQLQAQYSNLNKAIQAQERLLAQRRQEIADHYLPGQRLIPVQQGKKYGYKRQLSDEQWAIKPQFIAAEPFYEGLAAVLVTSQSGDSKWGFIDQQGQWIIKAQFGLVGNFHEGRAKAGIRYSKWGFINQRGDWLIEPQYYDVRDFSEGKAAVQVISEHGRWGYIDKRGEWLIKPKFNWADTFGQGKAAVRLERGDFIGYIDASGGWAIQPRFVETRPFSEGMAVVKESDRDNGRWGYIGENGQWQIKPQFDRATPFFEGKAAVSKPNENIWGYISKQGHWLIPPRFATASPFVHGRAQVTFDEETEMGDCRPKRRSWKSAQIDDQGQFLIGPISQSQNLGDGKCVKFDFHLNAESL